jgi:hypothetical protein
MRIASALSVGYALHPFERKDARRTRNALMASRKKPRSRRSTPEATLAQRRRDTLRPKTIEELEEEQGTRPFDWVEFKRTWKPLPFPENFDDEIKALRRGRGPIRRRSKS